MAMKMEPGNGNGHCTENGALELSMAAKNKIQVNKRSGNATAFVNDGAKVWEENRKKWVGDQSRRSKPEKDPIISWSTSYEELLSTHEPFSEPIPLPEMVDFLVDIWYDEDLYD